MSGHLLLLITSYSCYYIYTLTFLNLWTKLSEVYYFNFEMDTFPVPFV